MSIVTSKVLTIGTCLFLTLVSAVVGPMLDGVPTESQVDQAIALDKQDAVEDAKFAATEKAARVEEWVQAAREANPYLTEHDLSRVRASAMYLEGVR